MDPGLNIVREAPVELPTELRELTELTSHRDRFEVVREQEAVIAVRCKVCVAVRDQVREKLVVIAMIALRAVEDHTAVIYKAKAVSLGLASLEIWKLIVGLAFH